MSCTWPTENAQTRPAIDGVGVSHPGNVPSTGASYSESWYSVALHSAFGSIAALLWLQPTYASTAAAATAGYFISPAFTNPGDDSDHLQHSSRRVRTELGMHRVVAILMPRGSNSTWTVHRAHLCTGTGTRRRTLRPSAPVCRRDAAGSRRRCQGGGR